MKLNLASEKKLAGVKPALVKVIRRAAEITKQPFQVVSGSRSKAEQARLYAQGRTKPGPKVTWTMNSRHIGGNAIDFAALVNGKISWNAKYYPAVVKAFKAAAKDLKIPIVAGADWKARDLGHIQLA
jgi:peptidoglycan L-alanyl-D-glutamate endopeptidase CwlK